MTPFTEVYITVVSTAGPGDKRIPSIRILRYGMYQSIQYRSDYPVFKRIEHLRFRGYFTFTRRFFFGKKHVSIAEKCRNVRRRCSSFADAFPATRSISRSYQKEQCTPPSSSFSQSLQSPWALLLRAESQDRCVDIRQFHA